MALEQAEFAWPGGDNPGELNFEESVCSDYAKYILRSLEKVFPSWSAEDCRVTSLYPTDGIVGRYRITSPEDILFVRISSRMGHPILEKEVVDYLVVDGVSVNSIIYSEKIEWQGKTYRLDVRPFLDGRHFDGSNDDVGMLAGTLRILHRSFKTFRGEGRVKDLASKRYRRLSRIMELVAHSLRVRRFDIFAEYAIWTKENEDWLNEMAEQFDPKIQCHAAAQCLHGEIHPGNVVFLADGAPVLLDFEESVHVYAPPSWDLAFFVQRFSLSDNPDRVTLMDRLELIAKEYGRPLPKLAETMRQASWLAMAVIFDLYITYNIVTPLSEYEKFVRLERQARNLEGIL